MDAEDGGVVFHGIETGVAEHRPCLFDEITGAGLG